MLNALKRNFEVGQHIYVVDCKEENGERLVFKTKAEILKVDEKSETFLAILDGGISHTYSFKDYERLIFDTLDEASRVEEKLPKPQTIAYHVVDRWVYKRIVLGIYGQQDANETYDLVVRLNNGDDISIKEIDHSLFLGSSNARRNKR